MRSLTADEIKHVRGLAEPDRVKQCGVAQAVVRSYVPALCDMAEGFLRARLSAFHDGKRIRYSATADGIEGTDGFKATVPDPEARNKLLERLNAP